MPVQPGMFSSLLIGRPGNKIEVHQDGSMVFRDNSVAGVRLIDLLGGTVTIDPAVFVTVEVSDWTEVTVDGQTRYNVEVPHTWGTCDPLADVILWDLNNQMITVNTVEYRENSIFIQSTENESIKVLIKRL